MLIVSVVIPIYRVETYIERCVRSLFEQTYEDIEFVFVDDCSPDASIDILYRVMAEYPLRQSYVRVFCNEKNVGSASARNVGLNIARGEYVTFVDADDWIEEDGIEKMMQCAEETGADIVMSDFTMDSDGVLSISKQGFEKSDSLSLMKAMMTGKLHGSNCNKIYRRSLIEDNNIRFIDGADYTEDLAFNMKLLSLTNKITYLPIAYYHYCIRYESMSQKVVPSDIARKKDLQKVINVSDFSNWLYSRGLGNELEQEINYCKLIAKMPFLFVVTRRSCLRWCALFPEANKAIMANDRLPFTYKLELQLLRIKWISLFVWLQHMKIRLAKL